MSPLLALAAGLVLLAAGGDLLVRGASRVAVVAGLSPLVVGLTVVAFGTSAPELAVSLMAGARGEAGLALGNVVGSNIFNVLFILGLSAVVAPLAVAQQVVRREVPLMIGASLLLALLLLDGVVGRADGVLLLVGVVAYVVWSVRAGRRESRAVRREYEGVYAPDEPTRGGVRALLPAGALAAAGLAALVAGSRWLVDGAVALARAAGVSEVVVGLTVVAAGTSLPEVATSVVAAARGERDIAVGNVVGSNLFNILAILGAAAVASPAGLEAAPQLLGFDVPVMIAVAVACLPVFFTGLRISRWEGAFLLACYGGYIAYLVAVSTGRMAPAAMDRGVWLLAGALLAVTAAATGWGLLRRRGRPG